MKSSYKIAILILCQLFIFNVLFVRRFSPLQFEANFKLVKKGSWNAPVLDYVKLYFSEPGDEYYYYEWSTLVLGKKFEADYPAMDRYVHTLGNPLAVYMSENPRPLLPYRDIKFEYPPLAILPILVARLLCNDYMGYTRAFAAVFSLIYLFMVWVTHRLWKKLRPKERLTFPALLSLFLISTLFLGKLFVTRMDMFPSLLYLLALWAFIEERYYQSAFWIVLGFFTKGYSILLIPLFSLTLFHQRKFKKLSSCIALTMTLVAILFWGLNYGSKGAYWESFRFHSSRGIQIESLYALIPLISHLLFHTPMRIYEAYSSLNIRMPGAMWMPKLSAYLSLAVFAALYLSFWRSLKKTGKDNLPASLILFPALLLVAGFILTFKVFSPQFMIWLIPLIFLTVPRHREEFYLVFLTLLLLTQLIFPNFYSLLEVASPVAILMLLTRNLSLIFLFAWLIKDWRKKWKLEGAAGFETDSGVMR